MGILDKKIIGCVGAGNMGTAILTRLSQTLNKDNIVCFDIDKAKLDSLKKDIGIRTAKTVKELSNECDIIILAVKPDIIAAVAKEIDASIKDKIIISIAAGVSINSIKENLKSSHKIIRVMPNTPALIGEGMSVLSPDADVDDESLETAKEIFKSVGMVEVLPEKLMDAVTALSGCGPAYGFTLIQAMTDGGVKMGIPRDKALTLAAQTIAGAAKMIINNKEEPIILRGRVTSPGGSTIEAVHVLEKTGFSGIVMDAIDAARTKSEKLGKK